MTLDTLMLLQHLLDAQQMSVGDPDFDVMAPRVLVAKEELRQAIEAAFAMQQRIAPKGPVADATPVVDEVPLADKKA